MNLKSIDIVPDLPLDLDYALTALNTVSEGILIFDRNYNILYRNIAANSLLSREENSFNIIDFQNFQKKFKIYDVKTQKELHFEDLPISLAVNGLRFVDHQIFLKPEGKVSPIYLSCNGTPLISRQNVLIGGVLTFCDISKKYLAEKRIMQEKAFYKNILDWIPGGVFVYDNLNEFYFKNHKAEQIVKEMGKAGLTPAKNGQDVIKDHDALVLKKLEVMEFDEFIEYPSGRKHYRTIRFPVYHQASEKLLICAIAFDVTEKLAMEEKLENERVKSINASKLAAIGTLAGEIGHEINNPITIISSLTYMIREVMKDKKLTERFLTDKLDKMDATISRVTSIVKSLKNLSRKSTNESHGPCLLKEIFSDVLSLTELKLSKQNIKLIFDKKSPVLDYQLDCYQIQFSQVLINLIVNAADALHGSSSPTIEIAFRKTEESLFIDIKDNGRGVPDELREKVFEPFFTTKEHGQGTGLGLSISKNIVEAHGGEIFIAPQSEGSCFSIKLPKNLIV